MSFELLPTITPWLVGFAVVVVATVALALVAVADLAVSNRRIRVARQQSIRAYYGRLSPSH